MRILFILLYTFTTKAFNFHKDISLTYNSENSPLVKKPTRYLPFYKINPFIRENLHWDIYDIHDTPSSWSTEHIIPRSILLKQPENDAILDLYNLFNTSPHINSHRSNYKFTASIPINSKTFSVTNKKIAEKTKIIDTFRFNYKNNKLKLWLPIEESRGIISRSIAYMHHTYNITNIESVIDMDILQRWNFLHPPSKIEIQHMWKIFYIQGNINPFVISIQR
jgi:endonuclease I